MYVAVECQRFGRFYGIVLARGSGVLIVVGLFASCSAAKGIELERTVDFTTMVAHWANYAHEDYLPFVRETRPELVQVGFYGAHYWSLAHTKHGAGYPAHFPKIGLKQNRDWLKLLNRDLHQLDSTVVGHFNIEFLVGDPESAEGPRGHCNQAGPRPDGRGPALFTAEQSARIRGCAGSWPRAPRPWSPGTS